MGSSPTGVIISQLIKKSTVENERCCRARFVLRMLIFTSMAELGLGQGDVKYVTSSLIG